MKEKFKYAHMKVAEIYGDLSSCNRLRVGCVIVKDDTVIGIGYNGTPTGDDNACEYEGVTIPEVIHAEINALAKVAKSTNSSFDADLFVTVSPCIECAKLIKQSGIKTVYYKNDYRSDSGILFLRERGVKVVKLKL